MLTLPLVANAMEAPDAQPVDLRPLLMQPASPCTAVLTSLDDSTATLLSNFYAQRDGRPAWRDAAHRQQLQEQLEQLADDGLNPADYPLAQTADHCSDLQASSSYLRALLDLRRGRLSQQQLEPLWRDPQQARPDPQLATLSIALLQLDDPAAAFAATRPSLPQYQRLRAAYAAARLQPLPSWPALPTGPLLRPGKQDARVPLLRERLNLPADDAQAELYDPSTVSALADFQARHGLKPDGILGPASLTELNLDALTRREQLRINLERLRWLADDLGQAQVAINVAAAELLVLQQGEELWRTRTQVGRVERQTPLLASRINRLTLNPTWTVPPTILREDKLPAIRADRSYLSEHEMDVYDHAGNWLDPEQIDWDNPGAILLRQAAGAKNPLGQVALRFGNPFSVYLHDTPSRALFDKAPRLFSSGCVRVEAVDNLLTWLLPQAELASVQTRIASGKTEQYRLPQPAPLLIAYWTVEVDVDGQLRYAPDTYQHDARLIKALLASGS
ncbi:L,D-transpeptidase family protein [Pseudomonas sp. J452]|uniref:L,D-transpeptidase family protein n=1 Tax=Pseudomonas sp. J452 TaxID=2898441 RepID=UPI0021AD76ED|nr:L,D-transpeptidase family protein [Pseudomonas sp. J452]UUY09732.1 L,D-transpeptidase family protein [Pseudomonas sp. J452]